MERKVNPLFLEKGMFISQLSRPWMDTPFWIQGFIVRTDEELSALRKYCDFAYIDTNRGIEAEFYMEEDMELPSHPRLERNLLNKAVKSRYSPQVGLKQELSHAISVLEGSMSAYTRLLDQVRQDGVVDYGQIESLVTPLIQSIIRQPDTLVLLANLRNRHGYRRSHAINSCIYATAFGRYLGLNSTELNLLAAGMLLLDTGNIWVPDELLDKRGALSDEELREIRKHVYYTLKLLDISPGIPVDLINMALTHHERYDGSGYPNALSGLKTPVYGRIAAIVDCFDAMVRNRTCSDPMTPHAALQEIYRWRGKQFQPELVDQFLKALGTYPSGSLVELSSGEIALVVAQHPKHKLNPVILPLKHKNADTVVEPRVIDTAVKPVSARAKEIAILGDVSWEDAGIDSDRLYLELNHRLPDILINPVTPAFRMLDWFRHLLRRSN